MGSFVLNSAMLTKIGIVLLLEAFSLISSEEVFCNKEFVKRRIMMDGSDNVMLEASPHFNSNSSCCKVAFKNTVDCPVLKFSCSSFDIPCDNEDAKVEIKIGGQTRQRYCKDEFPMIETSSYLWVFVTEAAGQSQVNMNCNI